MVEGSGPRGPENGPGSKPVPLVEADGGRVRLTVQLTPGDTTIVSWKNLLIEANLSESSVPNPSVMGPFIEAQSAIVSKQLPLPPPPPPAAASHAKETVENELKESQTNRLSNVIERIERMYAGNDSSDEEDLVLDNMPDDDEYDTEDSFIDDTELDDYFQVDNSTMKHDGFFVNRGKLESIKPTISMDQQQKKRKRKDLVQGGGSDDGHNPHKIINMGNKGIKTSSSIPRSSTGEFYKEAIPKLDMLVQDSPPNPTDVSVKKISYIQVAVDPSGLQNGDSIKKQISEVNSTEKHISKWKERELQNTSTQKSNAKISNVAKSHSRKLQNNVDGRSLSIKRKVKGGLVEGLNLNVAASKAPLSMVESLTKRMEGSIVRPKSTNLDKTFTELKKIVGQVRPPSTDPRDPVNTQSTKKETTC